MRIFGQSNDGFTSILKAMAASGRKAEAGSRPIDLVEGRDYVVRQDPVSSARTEQRISEKPDGSVAQWIERHGSNVEDAGSTPVTPAIDRAIGRKAEAGGANE